MPGDCLAIGRSERRATLWHLPIGPLHETSPRLSPRGPRTVSLPRCGTPDTFSGFFCGDPTKARVVGALRVTPGRAASTGRPGALLAQTWCPAGRGVPGARELRPRLPISGGPAHGARRRRRRWLWRRRLEQAQGLRRPVDPPTRFHKALAFQLQLQCWLSLERRHIENPGGSFAVDLCPSCPLGSRGTRRSCF